MNQLLYVLVGILFSSTIWGSDLIIRDFGVYEFDNPSCRGSIRLEAIQPAHLSVRLHYIEPHQTTSVGTNKGSHFEIKPNEWVAIFSPPYRLWVFCGEKQVLYEKRSDGYRVFSKEYDPTIFEQMPESIRKHIP